MTVHSIPSRILELLSSEDSGSVRRKPTAVRAVRRRSGKSRVDELYVDAQTSIAPEYVGLPTDILASLKDARDALEEHVPTESLS